SPTPSLFALIIGINKYADKNIPELHGAAPDADEVDEFLLSVTGVSPDHVMNLRNEEATRDAIVGAIRKLTTNPAIKENDPILIFYAGHGAEVKAPLGWPPNNATGLVQMLVPHDFVWSGSDSCIRGQGILDITLSQLLADLAKANVGKMTVILDCCHSGSGTRKDRSDDTFAVRGIELPTGYTIPLDVLHDDTSSRASSIAQGFQTTGLRSHVLLAACMQGQEAKERQGHGAFTSALLRLLREEGVDKLTYKDVITRISDLPSQNPQCEGFHQNRILFNAKVANPRCELYHVRASSRPTQYILEGGAAHGITNKAEFAVYADRNMSSPIGMVIALQPTAFNTLCTLHPQSEVPFALSEPRFALQTRTGEGHDVRLFIELNIKLLDVFIRVMKEMQRTDVEKRQFYLVDSVDDEPDLVITLDNDLVQFRIMDQTCQQYGLTHMPLENKINPDYLYLILRNAAHFYWHLHRSNKEGRIATQKIELECIKLIRSGELTTDLEDLWLPDPAGHNFNVGGMIILNVKEGEDEEHDTYGYRIINNSNVPLYAAMFYFDVSDLSIDDYYLPGAAAHGTADISLPANGSLTIGFGASGTAPQTYFLREGQTVDVGFLKLFFSTENVDYSSIAQKSLFGEDSEGRAGKRKEPRRYLWDTLTIPIVQKQGWA
ncbi:caspase domain-containing protein, partial [Mycena rebaudengoi]